ncbi:uncharacterized protein MKK02DRAFT_43969 [Dioszegia hungarica]|uniref:Cep57 centrosome microtubule-binding domain-containing protein n=1 Tax=Dioszegia hungarica TaxID=4972 RepID=A0AA38H7C8_9TREE|nr:uncharacterized protein MKK02DRAFT_43969 [Dioszegia hungarica]KAI9635287.1 hypothetical protein MKK02DRAFT_43969 [Dioszegia hungarica]
MSRLPPITSSAFDLERRRLESTIDQDLSTISLSSIGSASGSGASGHGPIDGQLVDIGEDEGDRTFLSGSGTNMDNTLEYPRGFGQSLVHDKRQHDDWFNHPPARSPEPDADVHAHAFAQGPTGTPRAAAHNRRLERNASGLSVPSIGESPASTAGHHVSAVSLADGVFRRKGGAWSDDGSEFDPERSLGRLVGELGKVMGSGSGGRISPRPTSPFSAHHHSLSPPRSPSPLPTFTSKSQPTAQGRQRRPHSQDLNLSYTLSRANPLPSPPDSGGSRSGSGDQTTITNPYAASTFTKAALELQEDIEGRKASGTRGLVRPGQPARRALSDSTAHNIQQGAVPAAQGKGKARRVSTLQGQQEPRRTSSAPAGRRGDTSADVTGMTGLMATPAKGGAYEVLGKNGEVGGDAGASIPQTLATLHARLRGLETENSIARRRVRELEGELERAKGEVEDAKRSGGDRLREAMGQKSALEDLVKSLRTHLTRLTSDLEESKHLVHQFQTSQPALTSPPSPPRPGTASELAALRREIERLTREVSRLGGVVERGLETRRAARGEGTGREARVEDAEDEGDRTKFHSVPARSQATQLPKGNHEPRLPSKLRQGLHASASSNPTLMPPSTGPPTRTQPPTIPRAPPTPPSEDEAHPAPRRSASSSSRPMRHHGDRSKSRRGAEPRQEGPESPFPSIRAEDEAEFFAQMEEHAAQTATAPRSRTSSGEKRHVELPEEILRFGRGEVPPQTVLSRVIRELEDDFAHYKAIYCELADQYKLLDAASAAAKRHVLADHLKEVIDTLEQKADQISSLYDLLNFQDRPDTRGGPSGTTRKVSKSVADVMRMVKETLGEEGVERLKREGVVPLASRRRGGVV